MNVIKTFSRLSGIPEHRVLIVCPSKTGYAHLAVMVERESKRIPGRMIFIGKFHTNFLNPAAPAFYAGIVHSFITECVEAYYDASRRENGGAPPLEKDLSKIHRLYKRPEDILFALPPYSEMAA